MESLFRCRQGKSIHACLALPKHHQLLLIQTLTPFPLSSHRLLSQVSTSNLCLLNISFLKHSYMQIKPTEWLTHKNTLQLYLLHILLEWPSGHWTQQHQNSSSPQTNPYHWEILSCCSSGGGQTNTQFYFEAKIVKVIRWTKIMTMLLRKMQGLTRFQRVKQLKRTEKMW